MAAELHGIESRLQQVEAALAGIEGRLRTLEASGISAASGAVAGGPGTAADDAGTGGHRAAGTATAVGGGHEQFEMPMLLSLVGRTLMVFGGAFLLRAITDSGLLPRGAGVALGLAYAVTWLVAADRAAARSRPWSALFHGATGVAIAWSLLGEAALRFALLGPVASAAALTLVTGLALAIAWRRRLHSLAGFSTLGAIVTAVALSTSGQFVPFTLFLILLGVATLWISYDRDWFWIRWPSAIVADLAVVGLTTRALNPQQLERPDAVVAVQILLLAAYLGSFAARTLIRGRLVVPFEVLQTVAALAVGLGGAVVVARAAGTGQAALGAASAVIGAGCYAAAFAFVSRRQGLGENFYFYATLALVLTLTGCGLVLGGLTCTLALAALAVAATWIGHRLSRQTLIGHGAVYAVGAAAVSGLLEFSTSALAGAPQTWPQPIVAHWLALGAAVACLAVPLRDGTEPRTALGRLPWLVIAAIVALGAGAVAIVYLAPVVAGRPPDPGSLAALRTAVVAGAAVLMAWATRSERAWELGWLLYPVLFLGGVKLLVEDIPSSRPTTLFVALALFGAALVVAPRLTKRASRTSAR